jgi:nucleotide-binding universal stress UspA family protein
MLATDLSIGSLRPAQYASALAEEFHAQLTIVHVSTNGEIDSSQKRQAAAEIDELIPDMAELRKKTHYTIRNGDPVSELLRIAKLQDVNLIVMGVEESGIMADHAPWATISKVIREAHCPVLAVQPHIV